MNFIMGLKKPFINGKTPYVLKWENDIIKDIHSSQLSL